MNSIKNIKISNVKYIFIFTFFVYIANNILIVDKVAKWFVTKGSLDMGGLVAYLLSGYFLFVALFSVFAHRYTIKAFSYFVLITSAFATYFIVKYSIAVDRIMILNVFYTDPNETLALYSNQMLPYILFLIILPIIVINKTDIVFDKPLKHFGKFIAIFTLFFLLGAGMLYLKFNSIHTAGNASKRYIIYHLVPINVLGGLIADIQFYIRDHIKLKKRVPIKAKLTSNDDLVVVLAIGEASRKKSFTLYGYKGNNTNPLLSQIDDLKLLVGKAKYASTIDALPYILSKDDVKMPSVAKKAGVDTSCYVNFSIYGNCGTVEAVSVSNCGHDGNCYDEDTIAPLQKELSKYKAGKKLVVLHIGGGSHGALYNTRYPKEFQKFNPQCLDADVINKCTKEELYNSYDNTILYVDYVVSNLIKTVQKAKVPYVFIYLPDHGESLLEGGRIFHGMPPGMSLPKEQAEVPIIVKSSIPIKIIKKDEYKQKYIYDTVLELLDVDSPVLDKDNVFIQKID